MCDNCNDKTFTIDIKNPYINTDEKIEKAYDILEKAFNVGKKQLNEISPYLSMRQLEDKSKKQIEKNLYALLNNINLKWLHITKSNNDPFKLGTDIYINPSTGLPLTKGEWKKIKERLIRAFGSVYKNQEELFIKTALALGKILKNMPVDNAIKESLADLQFELADEVKKIEEDNLYANKILFAEEHAGELITNLSQNQYKKIHDTILQAQINKYSSKKLQSELFDKFADMNRDWRMIAVTETAMNDNDGQLLHEISNSQSTGKPAFVIGGSSPGACDWCRENINNKIFIVLEGPPNGDNDKIEYEGKEYTAIWPGKSNIGRSKADWWVCFPAHPHGRCYFTRYEPGYEEAWDKLQNAVQKAVEENKKGQWYTNI